MTKFHRATFIALLLLSAGCSAQTASESADARVIDNLRQAGANLSKPHTLEFFFYFQTEQDAQAAAKELDGLRYVVNEVRMDPDSESWTVLATKEIVPSLAEVTASTRELERLANEHHGQYDGWGTAVVK